MGAPAAVYEGVLGKPAGRRIGSRNLTPMRSTPAQAGLKPKGEISLLICCRCSKREMCGSMEGCINAVDC